jgi:hypothetical protein
MHGSSGNSISGYRQCIAGTNDNRTGIGLQQFDWQYI